MVWMKISWHVRRTKKLCIAWPNQLNYPIFRGFQNFNKIYIRNQPTRSHIRIHSSLVLCHSSPPSIFSGDHFCLPLSRAFHLGEKGPLPLPVPRERQKPVGDRSSSPSARIVIMPARGKLSLSFSSSVTHCAQVPLARALLYTYVCAHYLASRRRRRQVRGYVCMYVHICMG